MYSLLLIDCYWPVRLSVTDCSRAACDGLTVNGGQENERPKPKSIFKYWAHAYRYITFERVVMTAFIRWTQNNDDRRRTDITDRRNYILHSKAFSNLMKHYLYHMKNSCISQYIYIYMLVLFPAYIHAGKERAFCLLRLNGFKATDKKKASWFVKSLLLLV